MQFFISIPERKYLRPQAKGTMKRAELKRKGNNIGTDPLFFDGRLWQVWGTPPQIGEVPRRGGGVRNFIPIRPAVEINFVHSRNKFRPQMK